MSRSDLIPKNKNVVARFKICLFGDAGVGKTTLINRYLTNVFEERYKISVGMDFYVKKIKIKDKICSLQIWDFAGEEKFRFLLPNAVIGADGAIFIYDITRYNTFEHLHEWLKIFNETNEKEEQKVSTILVGSKIDLKDYRAVPSEEVVKFAKQHSFLQIVECSSKKGINVAETFEMLAKILMKKKKIG
ncbi:MAG: Rab family GTPase [Promethearchaeota archaeon]